MKFKFNIQPYQTKAVESVVKVFDGQPFYDGFTYRIDAAEFSLNQLSFNNFIGYANNKIALSHEQILNNINKIQAENNVKLDEKLDNIALDVEMETGTGKTYVYIKTMFELNIKYGWSKFIVVVPSIAIREGVYKSFEITQEHFMEQYHKKARYFVYNSKNLNAIDSFSQSNDINIMIINIQAFNARGEAARRIKTELDSFGSRRPIDIIKANKPIIILDEPQKIGGQATQESLKDFNPLFYLNYSATHKQHHTLVYALDALDAYNNKLVKKIEVKGFDVQNLTGADSYLYLDEIIISPDKPPRARLELEVKYNKEIKRVTRIINFKDDLFAL
ncbi:MAG: DEAD/DEAH box helicase family protein, partial [Synergistaceae bacterium]|nr:DEAD/DEAH box helicase family protein [Synergistaceae bacterium]